MTEEDKARFIAGGILGCIIAGVGVAVHIKDTHQELNKLKARDKMGTCIAKSWLKLNEIVNTPGSTISDAREAMSEENAFLNIVNEDLKQ